MEQYQIDEETAKELANQGLQTIFNTLQKASSFVTPYSNILKNEEFGPMISTRHLQSTFGKLTEQFQKRNRLPSILKAAADGNCAMTTLALSIELDTANKIALECLQENRQIPEEYPQLSGDPFSCAWNDGIEIRSYILRFYETSRLNRELPLSFGDVTYEEITESGEKCYKTRRMTRCDILCTETQFSNPKEIDMSLKPEAIEKRLAIAADYLKTISKSGQWCSTPSLVAFSFLRNPAKPIRVYQIDYNKQSIQKYIDIVPKDCLPCCPTTEDEFLLDLKNGHDDNVGEIEKNLNDDEEWLEEDECEEECSDEENETIQKDEIMKEETNVIKENETTIQENEIMKENTNTNNENVQQSTNNNIQEYCYNFTRILFTSNHYDLLATASERQRIIHIWPEVEKYFQTFDAEPIFKD